MSNSRRPVSRVAAAALLAAMPSQLNAVGWADHVPAEDPALASPPRLPIRASEPAPIHSSPESGSVILGALSATAYGLAAVPGAVGQAMWEVAYVFGLNSTPPTRPQNGEPIPDFDAAPNSAAGSAETGPGGARQSHLATRAGSDREITPRPHNAPAVEPAARRPPIADPVPALPVPAETVDPGLLANFIYDRGVRQPDGSYFVPKTLQRLFNVRTTTAREAELPVTLKIAGRIAPDPQSRGIVQATVTGRIEPPDAGLPVLGTVVTKGQLLGWVTPSVGVVDRTQVRREVARLTTEIRVETESLEILRQFSFVPFRDGKVYQAEQKLAGLRRERDALLPLLQTREALRAPADGIISVSNAVAGRIVQAGEIVFDIIDPARLWVEATAPDPLAATQAEHVVAASAMTPEGAKLDLAFVGSGLSLQQQSAPILFRIRNPPDGLRVGRPVTVSVVSEARRQRGIPVSRAAVTTGSDGVQEVWEQTAPEIFVPHPVRVQDIDGTSVLILDGVPEGARIVIHGSRLLAQLQ